MKLVFSLFFVLLISCTRLPNEARISPAQNVPSIEEVSREKWNNWSVQIEQGFKIAKMQLDQNPGIQVLGDARDFLRGSNGPLSFEEFNSVETWNYSLVQSSLGFWDSFHKFGSKGLFFCNKTVYCDALRERLDELGISKSKLSFYYANDPHLLGQILKWRPSGLFMSSSFDRFEELVGKKLLFEHGAKRLLMGLKANMVEIPRINSDEERYGSL